MSRAERELPRVLRGIKFAQTLCFSNRIRQELQQFRIGVADPMRDAPFVSVELGCSRCKKASAWEHAPFDVGQEGVTETLEPRDNRRATSVRIASVRLLRSVTASRIGYRLASDLDQVLLAITLDREDVPVGILEPGDLAAAGAG